MPIIMAKINPVRLGAPFGFDMDFTLPPMPHFPGPGDLDIGLPPAAPPPAPGPDAPAPAPPGEAAPEAPADFETFPAYPYPLAPRPERVYQVTQEEKPAATPPAEAPSSSDGMKTGLWVAGGVLAALVVANMVFAGKK